MFENSSDNYTQQEEVYDIYNNANSTINVEQESYNEQLKVYSI